MVTYNILMFSMHACMHACMATYKQGMQQWMDPAGMTVTHAP